MLSINLGVGYLGVHTVFLILSLADGFHDDVHSGGKMDASWHSWNHLSASPCSARCGNPISCRRSHSDKPLQLCETHSLCIFLIS